MLFFILSINFNQSYSEQPMQLQQTPQQPQQQQQWNSNLNQNPILDQSGLVASTLDDGLGATTTTASSSYNQKTSERMRQDEG